MDFKTLNNRIGWAVFAFATLVYFMTLEPTVSLWDCGEYIATSNKLEVGHPPGAPLFMMLGRIFSAFVPAESVALMINAMSALCSSFSILFLFWSITLLSKKLALKSENSSTKKADQVIDSVKAKTKRPQLNDGQKWAVLGSGIVGALAYTFCDSFWFSAVEAEVYAMSSFFTALVFWAILKYDDELIANKYANDPGAPKRKNPDRWLIFIAFMIGLSTGVHLLNLLAIPAVAFVYYFRKYEKTKPLGFILTGIISILVVAVIQEGIIPGTIKIAKWFEIWFVNGLGLPFSAGTFFFGLLLAAIITAGIIISRRKNMVNLNTAFVSLAMIYIGYSCFAMIVIRSNADPPIDENNPENLVSLNQYLLREQYGDWPLLSGPYFNSVRYDYFDTDGDWDDRSDLHLRAFVVKQGGNEVKGFESQSEAKKYASIYGGKIEEKYYMADSRDHSNPTYPDEFTTFFPRMYSSQSQHIQGYKLWSGYTKEGKEPVKNPYGYRDPETGKMVYEDIYLPSFGENLMFFLRYQIGHMYWRYFLWNFAGKQSDDQNHNGGLLEGNWQSGIGFIDSERLGDQSKVPSSITNKKSYNKFFFLPLIIGLIGLFFQVVKAPKDWFVVFLLFIFTGLAIVVYLNQKPIEPRERDYAYAGSFYAFAIWIGLGVYALYDFARNVQWKEYTRVALSALGIGVFILAMEFLQGGHHAFSYSLLYIAVVGLAMLAIMIASKKYLKKPVMQAGLAGLLAFSAPFIMGVQGWGDHDRSGRYTAREMAKNYLGACEPNAILFTNGDNDTFPLWYVQEVEGFRTDVRVVNLSLFNTDWYIEQMSRKAYDSPPVPFSFSKEMYRQGGKLDYVAFPNLVMNYSGKLSSLVRGMEAQGQTSSKEYKWAKKELIQAQDGIDGRSPVKYCQKYQGQPIELNTALKFIGGGSYNENQNADSLQLSNDYYNWIYLQGSRTAYLPSNQFYLPVNRQKVIENNVVPEEFEGQIVDTIRWKYNAGGLYKKDLMILDLINLTNWERPIYFAATGGSDAYAGLQQYLQLEGLVYRFIPVKGRSKSPYASTMGTIDTEKMYKVVMGELDEETYKWSGFNWGLNKEGLNVDYYTKRPTVNFRRYYISLSGELLAKNEAEKSYNVLNKCLADFPHENVPYDINTPYMVGLYFKLGNEFEDSGNNKLADEARSKARKIADTYIKILQENIAYALNMGVEFNTDASIASSVSMNYQMLSTLWDEASDNAPDNFYQKIQSLKKEITGQILSKWQSNLHEVQKITDNEEKLALAQDVFSPKYLDLMENFVFDLYDYYIRVVQKFPPQRTGKQAGLMKRAENASGSMDEQTKRYYEVLKEELNYLNSYGVTQQFVSQVFTRAYNQIQNGNAGARKQEIARMILQLWPSIGQGNAPE